ncbi:YceI family protein [Leptospira ilyithenensis]|uniref:YceI family protein n=1 Tax=Leptospira ilyithenensis TaxID=2484901 RepID=A0A4R9LL27_9LEPT|nr:YceI family protein [Leptospira ilyithenensis]TGN06447.1 YceI family protein [Leptospira ilyithenensis]
MKNIYLLAIICSAVVTTSVFAEEKCTYAYSPKQTSLEWTAFKFTEKTGIKGKFDSIQVNKTKAGATILDSVKDLSFKIAIASINSNLPYRDEKIKKFFFGSVKNGKEFKGSFSEIKGTNTGSAKLDLEFAGVKKSIPVQFTIKENTVEVAGSLDVLDFGLKSGLSRLNEECRDLHKGADGTSKLWPNVDFKIVSTLDKVCK